MKQIIILCWISLPVLGQWIPQASNTTASFRAVSAIDKNTCWVGGSKGTILRTIDGGNHWESLKIEGAESLDFRDVHGFDAQNAVAMSAGEAEKGAAKIYKTTDGGQHWALVFETNTKGVFFDGIDFWDSKNGIVFSDPINGKWFILLSHDGGNSWQTVAPENLPELQKGEAAFAASGTSLVIEGKKNAWICTGGGSQARVFFSKNQGKTWQVSPTEIEANQSSGLFGMKFLDKNKGMALGGDYANVNKDVANVVTTVNGGKTWTLASHTNPVGLKECLGLLGKKLIAVGPSGTCSTSDFGQTWQSIDTSAYHAISCANGVCWAVGGKGIIGKMTE